MPRSSSAKTGTWTELLLVADEFHGGHALAEDVELESLIKKLSVYFKLE